MHALIEEGAERTVTGAVLLLRDVSELRRRDRLILSKDATIREIHHRVKKQSADDFVVAQASGEATRLSRGEGGD